MSFPICPKLFLFFLIFLTACAPLQTPHTPSAIALSATPLPPPQAIDLGTLGKGLVYEAAWSPDGKLLAVRSSTGIYLHDTQTWKVVKTIRESDTKGETPAGLAFFPDSKTLGLSIWSTPGAFWRYDLQSGEVSPWLEDARLDLQSTPVFSPDGKTFAILNRVCEKAGTDGQTCARVLELRDGASGSLRYALQKGDYSFGPDDAVTAFVFSPDSKQLAVASADNFVRIWDTASGNLLYKLQHDSNVVDAAYSPNGRVLASASQDATVRFWDTQTGQNLSILRNFKHELQYVTYLNQSQKLLVGQSFDIFQEYALDGQSLPVEPPGVEMMVGTKWETTATVQTFISPDTHKMAVLLNDTLQIWDLNIGKPILTLPGYNSLISAWAFSPDSNLLAVADHNLHLWDISTRSWVATLPLDTYRVDGIAFHPNGKQLAVATEDGIVEIWDVTTHQKLDPIEYNPGNIQRAQIAYSPDGKKLAIAAGCGVQIWDVETRLPRQKFFTVIGDCRQAPTRVVFSADGSQLFYFDYNRRWGWDIASGETLFAVLTNTGQGSGSGAFALSAHLGVTWSETSPLQFFDPATGQNLYNLASPHVSGLFDRAALSPNGRLLAWENGRTLDLIDATSGATLLTVAAPRGVQILSFTPNSRFLISESSDGIVHLWDISDVTQRTKSTPPLTATFMPSVVPTPTATPVSVSPLSVQPLTPPTLETNAFRTESVAQRGKAWRWVKP